MSACKKNKKFWTLEKSDSKPISSVFENPRLINLGANGQNSRFREFWPKNLSQNRPGKPIAEISRIPDWHAI